MKDHSKDWLIPIKVTRSTENARRAVEILNSALKRLDSDVDGMDVTEEDVVDITAEWQGAKSERTIGCKLLPCRAG